MVSERMSIGTIGTKSDIGLHASEDGTMDDTAAAQNTQINTRTAQLSKEILDLRLENQRLLLNKDMDEKVKDEESMT